MSLLDKAKELLHIGKSEADEVDAEESLNERLEKFENDYAEKEIAKEKTSVTAAEVAVNTEFWTAKTKAELYKAGVANDVVIAEPFENGLPFIRIRVPAHQVEKANDIAFKVFAVKEFYEVSER